MTTSEHSGLSNQRLRVVICGAVQGVGFRPFVYRLARELNLSGWVINSTAGVMIEVEGDGFTLKEFLRRLILQKPPRSFIQSLESSYLDPVGYSGFEIRASSDQGEKKVLILPDIASCPDCIKEVFDPNNRRYLYPFTNCTYCGPRFSIILDLPYDRPNTTMRAFPMCAECRKEYENPEDRRFHAQPNACSKCGPHLELWSKEGRVLATHHQAFLQASQAILRGMIVAIKGLGGFHLTVDARDDEAVKRLHLRKGRKGKPFALMCPSISDVKNICEVSEGEERILLSPESPIVLLRKKDAYPIGTLPISAQVAPDNPMLGILLPYTPLHHMLMREINFPIVATSGNRAEEPICFDEKEAILRLGDIADLFLVHNRPIIRHVDDSIVRMVLGRELVLRRARGFAPLPVLANQTVQSIAAVGAHLKNTIALGVEHQVFISQHIGDLETVPAYDAFRSVFSDFKRLYGVKIESVACDSHPDYLSTRFANELGIPVIPVQHHRAHVCSCMLDNDLRGPVLGVSWDGTGFGNDGTVWGGEFLQISESGECTRIGHLRTFRLAGGEKAVREPRRSALGVLFEIFGREVFSKREITSIQAFTLQEHKVLEQMLMKKVNSPLTSSAGRLFDAVASILNIRHETLYEGQAAMEMEFAALRSSTEEKYDFKLLPHQGHNLQNLLVVDWEPMICEILDDLADQLSPTIVSRKFHNTLAQTILDVAKRIGVQNVVLTGGCFQNGLLTEGSVAKLRAGGLRPYWHQRIPPNDGGIAPGQMMAVTWGKG